MVSHRQGMRSLPLLFSLLFIFAQATKVHADGILEQLEREVSSIAARTRSAVVTIEGSATISLTTNPTGWISGKEWAVNGNNPFLNSIITAQPPADGLSTSGKKMELEILYRQKAELQLKKTEVEQKLGAEHPDLKAVKKQIEQLDDVIKNREKDPLSVQPSDIAINVLTMTDNRSRSGSGFSIGDGYIVSTADVLEGMKDPVVILDDGTRIKGNVVGVNSELNIGLVKLTAQANIPALKLGDSSLVEPGHFAISVGNQSGQANSVALMLVGGFRSEGTSSGNRFYPRLLQIAGTVGLGTSGAPLVNAKGEVIGVVAAISDTNQYLTYALPTRTASPTRQSERSVPGIRRTEKDPSAGQNPLTSPPVERLQDGAPEYFDRPLQNSFAPYTNLSERYFVGQPSVSSAGFAIPINNLKPVIEELRSGKPVVRAWIGIALEDKSIPHEIGGIIKIERTVKITGIYPGSPAANAGVQPGDSVVSLNGRAVKSSADVRETSVRIRPGLSLPIVVRRGNRELKLNLEIKARPATVPAPITEPVKESL